MFFFPPLFLSLQIFPPEGGVDLQLTRCSAFNVYGRVETAATCTTVGYAPAGDPTAHAAMRNLAKSRGFTMGSGVGRHDVVGFATGEELGAALLKHPGVIEAGVVFTNSTASKGEASYELWYNKTSLRSAAELRIDELGGYYKVWPSSLVTPLGSNA